MQTDPIGYEDQYNLYAYVGNDPANANDPSGESSKCSVNACDSNGLDGLEGVRGSGSRIGSIVVGAQSSTLAANGSKPQSGQQGIDDKVGEGVKSVKRKVDAAIDIVTDAVDSVVYDLNEIEEDIDRIFWGKKVPNEAYQTLAQYERQGYQWESGQSYDAHKYRN